MSVMPVAPWLMRSLTGMRSHVRMDIYTDSTPASPWFDGFHYRPEWSGSVTQRLFPRFSLIPEVFPKMHQSLSIVSRGSPHNYLKALLYLLGKSLYLHTSKKQELWRFVALFFQPLNARPQASICLLSDLLQTAKISILLSNTIYYLLISNRS